VIEDYNPWWVSRDRISELEVYRRFEEAEVKWIPDAIDKISFTPFSLNFLFGPRQVGKSTALLLTIKRLLDEGVNPKAIFYYSCDMLADYRELDEVLGDFIKVKRMNNVRSAYIFLDEITYPREWYRALKSRIDRGDKTNDKPRPSGVGFKNGCFSCFCCCVGLLLLSLRSLRSSTSCFIV